MSGNRLPEAEASRTRALAAEGYPPTVAAKMLGISGGALTIRAAKLGIKFKTAAQSRYEMFQGFAKRRLGPVEMSAESGIQLKAVMEYLKNHPEFDRAKDTKVAVPTFSCKPEAIARALEKLRIAG